MKAMIEAGAAAVRTKISWHRVKKCSHMGGKFWYQLRKLFRNWSRRVWH